MSNQEDGAKKERSGAKEEPIICLILDSSEKKDESEENCCIILTPACDFGNSAPAKPVKPTLVDYLKTKGRFNDGQVSLIPHLKDISVTKLSPSPVVNNLKFYKEISYSTTSSASPKVLNISYKPITETHVSALTREASSGNSVKLPTSFITELFTNANKVGRISPERIFELKNKWENSNLMYVLLDSIDKYFSAQHVDEVGVQPPRSLNQLCPSLHKTPYLHQLPALISSSENKVIAEAKRFTEKAKRSEKKKTGRAEKRVEGIVYVEDGPAPKRFNEDLENEPSVSGIIRKRRYKSEDFVDELDVKKCDDIKLIECCEFECLNPPILNSGIKLKTLKNVHDVQILGPVDFRGDWFKKIFFVMTSISEYESVSRVPFVYPRLIQQIEHAQGNLMIDFDKMRDLTGLLAVLISNKPCVTPKYLMCLARGIKPVSHEWIIECSKYKKLLPLDFYMLPRGWSVEKEEFVRMSDRKNVFPLRGLKICVVYDCNADFKDFWSKICRALGAYVQSNFKDAVDLDLIIAEYGMHVELTKSTANTPIVSAKWVIECLIRGELPNRNAHPSYYHLCDQ